MNPNFISTPAVCTSPADPHRRLEFFNLILAPEGPFFLATKKLGSKGMRHIAYTNLTDLAEAVASLDRDQN